MPVTFRPAVRVNTPLIIGIAGPTKSGKTYSALRLATGLANGKPIAMINAEGPRGHQYAEKFTYLACDLEAPYRPQKYIEALEAARASKPGCIIIDSVSHCHDGPGGILEWHEEILDEKCGRDFDKRNRMNFAAWNEPKAAENQLIYTMLDMPCPLILCMRAKEKIKIEPGKPPRDLGWQPIVGERVAFETIFTLMLPPYSKGVPALESSAMREPFDTLVDWRKPIEEALGKKLAEWSMGKGAAVETRDRELEKDWVPTGDGASSDVFEESQAVSLAELAIDRATDDTRQKVWDEIVKDKRIGSASRQALYTRMKKRMKEVRK